MIYYLEQFKYCLELWDEANMFLGSFGRYTGGNAMYDRSCYNELANAVDLFQRDLKTSGQRVRIVDPRLCICLLGCILLYIYLS